MTDDKKIHPTHFQITKDMPWKEKERQAILLLKQIIFAHADSFSYDLDLWYSVNKLLSKDKDLVEWVMKYKGE